MNILFMGTPDFARDSLKSIYNAKHNIVGVVTNPDKKKGRNMKLLFSPVKEFAVEKNLDIFQPEKIRGNDEFINKIKELNPDVICVVAYGKILPKEILEISKYGCINVHASLLPKYRGAAPIQWAVINGDKETGVCTMFMDENMDTGDIILSKKTEIFKDETTGELWDRLSEMGGNLLVETLEKIENNNYERIKQKGETCLAPKITKELSRIDWENKTAEEIRNLTRGLNPFMGTYSFLGDKKYKFWKMETISIDEFINKFDEFKDFDYRIKEMIPGTIIIADDKNGMYVKAKDRIIKIIEIQAENSKKMNITDFLRGNKISFGAIFE